MKVPLGAVKLVYSSGMEREARSRPLSSVGGASVVGSVRAGDGSSPYEAASSHLAAIERRSRDIMGTTPPLSVSVFHSSLDVHTLFVF